MSGYYQRHILVCTNQKPGGKACCAEKGAAETFEYLRTRLLERGLQGPGMLRTSKTGCLGRCAMGPCMVIYPEGVWYRCHTEADVDEVIEKHLVGGETVTRLLMDEPS
ncbi:(2Fe-2S) ferredoxin [Legionella geestiana]|uniref:(2Fe-2S) ferredoxin n=1 Tax=Legionella geestiana TaxID=45065 RepID=A0A0W0TLM7_9GAMM|nr:(2Fe-2S) ferredoxin domain-containing protein [Legionella geestiana]KTC96508.1 (2Fe-2S) ferredoxin [Legionella geestiana]QBS12549.1 (2Fe-2S) ferredoxin domain-containing protein [Legionella geestiana]QDQ39735.1 (2Fe-2S) ferredoxin domain-containing protein [Legionella geestiana]STX55004.1 (2Fe-2S) ferredoxin [Legionella geestiana]